MALCSRLFGMFAVLAAGLILSGCLMQPPATLPVSRDTPFVLDVPDTDKHTTTARFQQAEMPAPPQPLTGQIPPPPGQPAAPTPGLQPVGLSALNKSPGTVHVRAWVNGKPIFEDEVFNILGPQLRKIITEAPPAQRDDEMQKAFSKTLETLIDNELLVQEALRMLEKNPKFLEKMKSYASKEAQKQIAGQMRRMEVPTIEEYKVVLLGQGTTLESVRRMLERDMIAGEFLRAKIRPNIEKEVCHEVIFDYYKQHLNEFMQVDRVKWQDIFIAVGPKHPTMADAKQFAAQLLQHWVAGEDIAKLVEFDDGDSRFRKGDGAGEIKGDIKPRELEPYLFALKDGEFGPPLELTTGVHIYRVLKRDVAGVMPFDDKTQTLIGNKLKNEMAEQERRHLIRHLRERALIEIEK
jgi:peptidyl-prolyl cis-trans isomerase SurA